MAFMYGLKQAKVQSIVFLLLSLTIVLVISRSVLTVKSPCANCETQQAGAFFEFFIAKEIYHTGKPVS